MKTQSGALLVELVMAIPVLLLFVAFTVELGQSFREEVRLTDIARSTARLIAGYRVGGYDFQELDCHDLKEALRKTMSQQGVRWANYDYLIEPLDLNEVSGDGVQTFGCYSKKVPAVRIVLTRKAGTLIFPSRVAGMFYKPRAEVVFTLEAHRAILESCG